MKKKLIYTTVLISFLLVLMSMAFINITSFEKVEFSMVEIGCEHVNTTQPLGDFIDKELSDVIKLSAYGNNRLILFSTEDGFISYENDWNRCNGKLVQIFIEIDKCMDVDETIILTYKDGSQKTINLRSKNGYLIKNTV